MHLRRLVAFLFGNPMKMMDKNSNQESATMISEKSAFRVPILFWCFLFHICCLLSAWLFDGLGILNLKKCPVDISSRVNQGVHPENCSTREIKACGEYRIADPEKGITFYESEQIPGTSKDQGQNGQDNEPADNPEKVEIPSGIESFRVVIVVVKIL
jgi:hypothetical protein